MTTQNEHKTCRDCLAFKAGAALTHYVKRCKKCDALVCSTDPACFRYEQNTNP